MAGRQIVGRNDEAALLYWVPWIAWSPMELEGILKDSFQEPGILGER